MIKIKILLIQILFTKYPMEKIRKFLSDSQENLHEYLKKEKNKNREKKGSVFKASITSFLEKIDKIFKKLFDILPKEIVEPFSSMKISKLFLKLYECVKYKEFTIFEQLLDLIINIISSLIQNLALQNTIIEQQKIKIKEFEDILKSLSENFEEKIEKKFEELDISSSLNIYCECNTIIKRF